ncbi:MAG: hypothetical protein OEV80_05070, partial [candidate division Zixibacteria bacterium]|nr:hypothetical protein [candidate division Zixibacteria bacterium]
MNFGFRCCHATRVTASGSVAGCRAGSPRHHKRTTLSAGSRRGAQAKTGPPYIELLNTGEGLPTQKYVMISSATIS